MSKQKLKSCCILLTIRNWSFRVSCASLIQEDMFPYYHALFVDSYVKVGIEKKIQILMFGGHMQHIGNGAGLLQTFLNSVKKKTEKLGKFNNLANFILTSGVKMWYSFIKGRINKPNSHIVDKYRFFLLLNRFVFLSSLGRRKNESCRVE